MKRRRKKKGEKRNKTFRCILKFSARVNNQNDLIRIILSIYRRVGIGSEAEDGHFNSYCKLGKKKCYVNTC